MLQPHLNNQHFYCPLRCTLLLEVLQYHQDKWILSNEFHWFFKIVVKNKILCKTYNTCTLNPACSVATGCHQVSCLYWEHLSYLLRGISPLNWYMNILNGLQGRLKYAVIQIKFTRMHIFSMYLQSGAHRHCYWRFIAVLIWNFLSVDMQKTKPPNSSGNIQKH